MSTSEPGRPLRVLFVEQFGVGGLVHYAHSLCQALAANGLDMALLTSVDYELESLPRDYRLLADLPLWNPHNRDVPRKHGVARRLAQVTKGLRYLRGLALTLHIISREQPDIVHITEMKFLPDLLLVLCRGTACLVHTCHNVQRFSDSQTGSIVRSGRLWHWALASMYRHCDGVIFHSADNIREFREVFGFEPVLWDAIPHGEYDLFAAARDVPMDTARRALGLPGHGPMVLFFGSIRRYKGLDVLLEAIAILRRSFPDVRLVVAGAPGKDVDIDALRLRATRLGLETSVEWHVGYVPLDKVNLYFYASDVVALSHRKVYESGVLKIAQALGRPVVVTAAGGLREAVEDGQAGIVVPPENAQELAQALEYILRNRGKASVLADRGRVLAQGRYGWSQVAEKTAALYRRIINTQCGS